MNYKILSTNTNIIKKAKNAFNVLNMNESIHIQDVSFYLIDAKSINKDSLLSYKNKNKFSSLLFVVNNEEDINICLQNSFTNYLHSTFTIQELLSWCKYFLHKKKKSILYINEKVFINFDDKILSINKNEISLSKQELNLLQKLHINKYTNTNILKQELNLSSTTSIRTIINRIRNKTYKDLILQKKDFGYKLNAEDFKNEKKELVNEAQLTELKEQNTLLQEIVDDSNLFIVTFIHKELYCINKAFRHYLTDEIIDLLWSENRGDFFHLIKHENNTYTQLKEKLFQKGKHNVILEHIFPSQAFELKTLYFKEIDKHLFIFSKS